MSGPTHVVNIRCSICSSFQAFDVYGHELARTDELVSNMICGACVKKISENEGLRQLIISTVKPSPNVEIEYEIKVKQVKPVVNVYKGNIF